MNRAKNYCRAMAAVFLVALTPAVPAPVWAEEHGHEEHGHEERGHEAVRLSDEEMEEFGIEVEAAGSGTIETTVTIPGEVRPNEDRVAHIVPRYSGIVKEVRARIGDWVDEGTVLALIESDESLTPFEVRTLISGTVIDKHITLGESVSRDRDVFVIADLRTVWIDLAVYQRDIGRVTVGREAHVSAGHGFVETTGTIGYVTPIVDEETRTATARIVLPNRDGSWLPGMFVTGKVVVERAEVPVAVPRTALFTVDDRTVLFVEDEDGFEPKPVTVGRSGEARVEILSGIGPGDRYVSRGGFTLKAELGKESFGDGHAH